MEFFTSREKFDYLSGVMGSLSPYHADKFFGMVKRDATLDNLWFEYCNSDDTPADAILEALESFIQSSDLADEINSRLTLWVAHKQIEWCDDCETELESWQRMEYLDKLEAIDQNNGPDWHAIAN